MSNALKLQSEVVKNELGQEYLKLITCKALERHMYKEL